jgi:hypothetical protein
LKGENTKEGMWTAEMIKKAMIKVKEKMVKVTAKVDN